MVFSSIPFLYFFLPAILLLYYLSPARVKNYTLLLSGVIFYFYGEQLLVFLMLFTAFWDYFMTRLICFLKPTRPKAAKAAFVFTVAVDLGILIYFKYLNFLIDSVNTVFYTDFRLMNIVLPIGISFYTFQSVSYVVDVYLGKTELQKNPFSYATYLTLFPQLIAGPIVRYASVEERLRHREHRLDAFASGVFRFVIGLSKKILIANILGEFGKVYADLPEKTVLISWVYAFSYALQIYFDFSGYSDMAIGLGKMFGFEFLENFNYPFISKSITEFWRRWHISLGTWFRDYVYIPLGGNRRHRLFNVFAVWFLTGLWHGAGWNFIVWGLYNALFLMIEKTFFFRKSRKTNPTVRGSILSRLYTIPVLSVGFMIFAGADIDIFQQLSAMFGFGGTPFMSDSGLYFLQDYGAVFFLAVIAATPLGAWVASAAVKSKFPFVCASAKWAVPVVTALLSVLCTVELVDSTFNPFLYFRF